LDAIIRIVSGAIKATSFQRTAGFNDKHGYVSVCRRRHAFIQRIQNISEK